MVEIKFLADPNSVEWIGKRFLDYYCDLGYEFISGASLLNPSVPMSFVMSAGMVQFEGMSGKKREGNHFVLTQNCFRYFDLEQIGESNTHLSLFQMPGAFDFGAVDKHATINRVWTLLIDVYGLDPKSLFVTYFSGGLVDGQVMPADWETAVVWQTVGVPSERIYGLGAESNFWMQTSQAVGLQNSRKRGPNTEVFFDRGVQYDCGNACKPGCHCGRFVEFLNILFITHQVDKSHALLPMQEPFTEMVIGKERLASVLQKKESVFEIDAIYPLIQQLRCFSKPLPVEIEGLKPAKFENIFVDHLRALLFLTADGAPAPGKGGRARLMRILIRELLTSQRLLGISDPGFLRSMILTACELYPQPIRIQKLVLDYVANENERFERTVQVGLYDLEAILQRNHHMLSGKDAVALEKKHGLPLPLLRYRLWQKNIEFNQDDYELARMHNFHGIVDAKLGSTFTKPVLREQTTNAVIQKFLESYQRLGYTLLPGSSLLDESIPMSFVMSAGLVQIERATGLISYQKNQRAVILQNCFRHFDLDRIGHSSIHLSFFRMLGAFTFGPISRELQISMAWDLATRVYQIPSESLWATYFGGDTISGNRFEADSETRQAWRRVGIRDDHLIGLDGESNFWKQSALVTGPEHTNKCGPNSELFFDRGEHLACGPDCRPGCHCGRFIEFINMLFINWMLDENTGRAQRMEMPFAESVVGVERLAMIVQGAGNIYDIDSIQPLMLDIRRSSHAAQLSEQENLYHERIIADHIRALLFLVADHAPAPGKGGRSFLMRRLVRDLLVSQKLLRIRENTYLRKLIERAAVLYKDYKPALLFSGPTLMRYILEEKSHFEHTMKSGFDQLEYALSRQDVDWISGQDVLAYEKEYGLPLPLLTHFLSEKDIIYNPKAYEAAKELWSRDRAAAQVQT